jgi:hypothetical protein
MNKTLMALALTLSLAAVTMPAHAKSFLPDLDVDTQDVSAFSDASNALNDIASYNDTNSDNSINSDNFTKVEDQDDVGSYNDVDSYNTLQQGLLNADDYSSNYVDNIATDHGTILDGDVSVGESGGYGWFGPKGLGGGDTEVAANTGFMYDSIVGEDNAQFGDVGVALTGGAGVGGYNTTGSINNNQNQINLVTFPH